MKYIVLTIACVLVLAVVASLVSSAMNARVVRELREEPDGQRAEKVMLLMLPSGKSIPVNYLRDGGWVYAGADFPWWRELRGDGRPVTLLIRGETLRGRGRAIKGNPELRASVFERLRPAAAKWTGTLVAIALEAPSG